MAFIIIYHFKHSGGGAGVRGHFTDFQDQRIRPEYFLSVAAEGDRLTLYADVKQSTMNQAVLPASSWGSASVHRQSLVC